MSKFEKIWIGDGSTLEALFRKFKSLEDIEPGNLARKIGVVMDLVTRLPPDELSLPFERISLEMIDRGSKEFFFQFTP